jgi:hypothetical protein
MSDVDKIVRSSDPQVVASWMADQIAGGRTKAEVMRELTRAMQSLPPPDEDMPPEAITRWVNDMVASGRAVFEQDCATALGIHRSSLTRLKREGGTKMTALACAAALAGLKPYGGA